MVPLRKELNMYSWRRYQLIFQVLVPSRIWSISSNPKFNEEMGSTVAQDFINPPSTARNQTESKKIRCYRKDPFDTQNKTINYWIISRWKSSTQLFKLKSFRRQEEKLDERKEHSFSFNLAWELLRSCLLATDAHSVSTFPLHNQISGDCALASFVTRYLPTSSTYYKDFKTTALLDYGHVFTIKWL